MTRTLLLFARRPPRLSALIVAGLCESAWADGRNFSQGDKRATLYPVPRTECHLGVILDALSTATRRPKAHTNRPLPSNSRPRASSVPRKRSPRSQGPWPAMSPHNNGVLAKRNPFQDDRSSTCGDVLSVFRRRLAWGLASLLVFIRGNGPRIAANLAARSAWLVRRNLSRRRMFSFPHLLVLVWMFVLLRGEGWIFHWKVDKCRWEHWEDWPEGAKPHHLIFVADPQLTDPHSYPGRPWPLSDLTILVTDNYLRRGYSELQSQLQPDSLFFLGDLFDGGREWATLADFEDAEWAKPYPKGEEDYAPMWRKTYGQDYWLGEYLRFSDIFFKPYYDEDTIDPGSTSLGRKLVASLPGNHDLGFGSMVKVPVRDRFSAYFGEPNRVDVVGNHTIVSVDTVSLSAGTSEQAKTEDLEHIYGPADEFLRGVKDAKRRAVQEELRFWRGDVESQLDRSVIDATNVKESPAPETQGDVADFPTILLTHVPLYRPPGTPCGPLREHWPPSKPLATDAKGDVVDHRNAIAVSSGYQYQNVLTAADSSKLLSSIGGVKAVFSGDDHDYCEVEHKDGAVEITVKSISMAMGVSSPGFLMLSMWNPVDESGRPLHDAEATIQTHLCLLPNQNRTYFSYIYLGLVTFTLLTARALLVSLISLPAFAHSLSPPYPRRQGLPRYKEKRDDDRPRHRSLSRSSSSSSSRSRRKKWGWPGQQKQLRIQVYDDFYDGGKSRSSWRAAARRRNIDVRVVWKELAATAWRVVWVVLLFWGWLNWV